VTRSIELRTSVPGPRSRAILARKEQSVAAPLTPSFPIVVAEAHGVRLTDVDGNTFIDFTGGVGCLNVGHSHPKVVAAARAQLERYSHTDITVVPYEPYVALAERLLERVPISAPTRAAFFSA
jgi:4-aminobutyrate aminotransferase/(S)-3-amino-2-methylpropionate transaminase